MSEFTPSITTEQPKPATSPSSADSPSVQPKSSFRKWAGLGVLSLGLAIVVIDTTLLNVSLSTIIRDLHTDLKSIQWVITAYALVLAAFTITGGRLGDLFGRKRMFMVGAVIFAVGSFLASVAHTIPILLLGESIIEGFGAALMMPATASLVVANFEGKDRATAFGVWGGVAGASSAIGPLLGGYLTSQYSWRWGFRINLFIALLVIVGSLWFLKESKDDRKPTLDWWGVILSSLGLLSITYGIIESSTYGWWKAKQLLMLGSYQIDLWGISIVPFAIAIGLFFLAVFFWWEKRIEEKGKTPLVSLSILKNSQFTSGVLTVSILTLGMTGLIFALPVFLQTVKNLDAFHTGLAMIPLSLALLIAAPIAGSLSKKITPKYLIQAGLLIDVVGMFVLSWSLKSDMSISRLIPGLTLYGLGMGMVMAPISNLTLSAVPVQQAGEASGINNTMRQVGATLGAAIVGAAVLTSLTGYLVKGVAVSPVIPEQAKIQIIKTVSNPDSNVEFSTGAQLNQDTPPAVSNELSQLVKEATTKAAKDAFVYAALFAFLGFIAALFLPTTTVHAEDTGEEEKTSRKFGNTKIVTAGVLVIASISGAMWFVHHTSLQTITTGATQSLADIQNAFQPPQQNQNTLPPATSSPTTTIPAPATTTPPATPLEIRGPSTQNQLPTTTIQTYTNQTLGFEVQLTSDWQAQQHSGNEVVLVNQTGQQASIQIYPGAPTDLSGVQAQLQGSPSVKTITQTSFQGEPALGFTTTSQEQGIAIIHQGKLYYIMGALSSAPFNSFRFI
jgi:EmrB/QacA subfamily drug resistance transporter